VSKLVGQSIMTGFAGTVPSASLLARIKAGQVGGVILFGANIATPAQVARLVGQLQAAAAAGGNPPLLISTDQEGGIVKRLPDGPPDLSPAEIGTTGSAAKARAEGRSTGAYLRRLGVDVDLAPVLDTPFGPASFLGTRAFSGNPAVNATIGTAFVQGLQAGGAAATAKHFPGLGTARANTDTSKVVVGDSKAALVARLRTFAAAIDGGVDLVMVSNAGYTAFDPTGTPAVLSRPIVTGLLRGQLGFRGVVISDALEAPGPAAYLDEPVRALKAGVDVLLYTTESTSAAAYSQLVSAAANGTLPLSVVTASAARIAALKSRLAHG
jgi:beta-N-acetylhexosaminidase